MTAPEPDDGPPDILLSPPHVTDDDRAAVLAALDSGWLAPAGPALTEFEAAGARRTGRAHAAALSSGTAALHLALHLAGVGPGDRVLVSDLTFAASANAVAVSASLEPASEATLMAFAAYVLAALLRG